MNYKETLNSGLKRGYEVILESEELNKNIEAKIEEVKKTIKMDGFRPGKVPTNIIVQKHGEAINSEVLNKMVNENVSKIIQEKNHRPVSQPKIDFKDSSKDKEKKDQKVFNVEFELFPEHKRGFQPVTSDFATLHTESMHSPFRFELFCQHPSRFQTILGVDFYYSPKPTGMSLRTPGPVVANCTKVPPPFALYSLTSVDLHAI